MLEPNPTMLNPSADIQISTSIKTYKYKIEQTAKGARVTVHGDTIDEIVADYYRLRTKLEAEGFKVAPGE
jgi:hypothetical protein